MKPEVHSMESFEGLLSLVLSIAAAALLPFAYILYFLILSSAGATNLLLVTLLIPVSAILLGTIILGEQLELKHMWGMGLISIGLLSLDGRVFPPLLQLRETTDNSPTMIDRILK